MPKYTGVVALTIDICVDVTADNEDDAEYEMKQIALEGFDRADLQAEVVSIERVKPPKKKTAAKKRKT